MADEISDDSDAPGWTAIDATFARVYGDQEPSHWGTVLPAMLGGNDPLNGISVFRSRRGTPHFHYVTYGFTELYQKESEDPEVSGFGFEVTFRLAGDIDGNPPMWPLNFLQNMARYVFESGNRFAAGHTVNLNGPIALEEQTDIVCIAFVRDPDAGEITTPNGRVTFLQVVGLCLDEYELIQNWDCDSFLAELKSRDSLLTTDLVRKSLLSDPALARELGRRADAEGSSQGEFFATLADWNADSGRVHVRIAANAAGNVAQLLKRRLPFGNLFCVWGPNQAIAFLPDETCGWQVAEDTDEVLELLLDAGVAASLAEKLRPVRGTYRIPQCPWLTVEVVPTEIKDEEGRVIRVIG